MPASPPVGLLQERANTSPILMASSLQQDGNASEMASATKPAKSSQISVDDPELASDQRRVNAAETIQKNYRGYRARRALAGWNIDSSTRWVDAVKEAQYRNLIRPRARRGVSELQPVKSNDPSSFAHSEWRRLREVARRANNDDTSDTAGEDEMTEEQLREYKQKKREQKAERDRNAKLMGLEYFLEMVDQKHRYGSHLRKYHAIWKESDTQDNFFYWLDEGAGRYIDAPGCTRERLDRDQVRYLNREERYQYLVKVDKAGRLRWRKNDELVNTSLEYKDSLQGIVRYDDPTPAFREDKRYPGGTPITADDSLSSSGSDLSEVDTEPYANTELDKAKGVKKVQYVSAAAVLNHLLQSTTKKNTWIFVADTSFRLYIGIKQSGAFQHSSFLHGSRISAAGVIKVKEGQIRRLSPLSGHYRPPTKNFRAFVHSLRSQNVDMSRVSISRSYAVLLGLEGYKMTKSRTKSGLQEIERQLERVFSPEEAKKKAEAEQDKSASAKKEREWLERQRSEQRAQGWTSSIRRKLTEATGSKNSKA